MAVGIVDALEVIEIEQDHGAARGGTLQMRQNLAQEAPAVGQTGQSVRLGCDTKPSFRPLPHQRELQEAQENNEADRTDQRQDDGRARGQGVGAGIERIDQQMDGAGDQQGQLDGDSRHRKR